MLNCQSLLETPKRSILGEVTNSLYVSPTANLKLLTNVALQCAYQRKEKSLQILCDRFLELYPLHSRIVNAEIHLDATAQRLGVEKRRIYDIINILEALQCATHRRKNTYTWHGSSKLSQFLANLKSQGESVGVSHSLHGRRKYQSVPKRRSLGDLAQRFLMMFLVEPPNTLINLEMAVAALIHQPPRMTTDKNVEADKADRQLKSKIRRLYDIANVLSSIGLIEKVSASTILKKPVFRYTGPKCFTVKANTLTPISSTLLTPDSINVQPSSVAYPSTARSKRKLVFSSPSHSTEESSSSNATPPHSPWHEILQVAGREWYRINNE